MKDKSFFMILFFIFFISISVSYANDIDISVDSTITEKLSDQTSYVKDTEIFSKNKNVNDSSYNNNHNKNNYSSKILASGDEKPSKLSQNSILNASSSVNNFLSKNNKLPNYVTISNYKFSMPEFLYLLSKTLQYKYKKLNSQIIVKYGVKNPIKPTGTDINGKISSKNYYDFASRVASYIINNNIAPNYVTIKLGKMQYQTAIHALVKILIYHSNYKKLPSSLSLNVKKTSSLNKYFPKYSQTSNLQSSSLNIQSTNNINNNYAALNDKYYGGSLGIYLAQTKNCQVNSGIIKSLAIDITQNCTTTLEKSTAIYNWVRNRIDYSFYYNTKFGAETTISKKYGNCVDQSHLLIALSRSLNIPARYVHGTCKFISGNVYGHVWAQILIDDTWTVADPTSSKNSLGIVNNWYISSYTLHGKYSEITF